MPIFKTLFLGFLVVATLAGTSSAARAQDETTGEPTARSSGGSGLFNASSGKFGSAGQLVFSMASEGEFPFRFTKTNGSDWNLAFRPALDYFIKPSVSVGALVRLETNGGGSTVGVGLRAGLDVPLGSVVSLWVRGGLSFDHFSVNNGPDRSVTTLSVGAPFLFHLVPHFFMGVGPFLSVPLTDSQAMASKDPTFGLTAIVGGYF